MNLRSVVDAASDRYGDRVAIQHKAQQVAYAELPEAIDRVSEQTPWLGGARVAVMLTDSIPTCLLHLHLFRSGATAIPLSVQATTPHLASVFQRVQPHYVVTNEILYKKHAEVLGRVDCVVVRTRDGAPEFDLRAAGAGGSARADEREPEDVRLVLFTSGSTGTPKGVCLSESNLLSAAGMMAEFMDLSEDRRTLVTVPMYDYYGYIQILGHVLRGAGCIYGESSAFLGSLLKAIEAEQATDLAIVPFSLRQILGAVEKGARPTLEKIRFVTSSSDMLGEDLLARAFGLNPELVVYNVYGLTEAGRACYRRMTADTPFSSSIGRPSTGVDILLDGSAAEPGEIVIQGPNVAVGYLQGIADDRIELAPTGGRIASGDLGYLDEAGEIVLLGRRDHVINVMGEKIHPLEIEALALRIPEITDALARPVTDANGKVSIELDVVCATLDACRPALQQLLREHLPRAFVPTAIRAVAEIERTELGAKSKRSKAS